MNTSLTIDGDQGESGSAPPSLLREFWHSFSASRGALIAATFFILLVIAAALAPWIAPHAPAAQYRDAFLTPPSWLEGGSLKFLLGTDELGRDILSRLLYGARLSLMIGLVSVLLSALPGVALGLTSAFYPKWIGTGIMRLMDIMMALPSLLLAVAVVAVLGPGLRNTMIAIAIVSLPSYVRLARASAMSELPRDYVVASRLAGAGQLRLMFNTVLPNCMAPIIVQAALTISNAILEAAALGFLGLGAQPPSPEWGAMLASAREFLQASPWIVTEPGLAILITVLAINLVGDGLRDALDPKMRRS